MKNLTSCTEVSIDKTCCNGNRRLKVLVFVVAYNAEKTIDTVLSRIPSSLKNQYDLEILVIDDASNDQTFNRAYTSSVSGQLPYPVHVLLNPVNQGYGGNQKIGYHYAMENNFDIVALIHGDGQYDPECLPELICPLADGEADAVFGTRMMTWTGALRGGMPLYKYFGNRILTWIQNRLLGASLSEFHSGYRLYSADALKNIPFDRNTGDFHFDTEIIIQLILAGLRIKEISIPTYYGKEKCHVNGLIYAWNVLCETVQARLQAYGVLYDRKYDIYPGKAQKYISKLSFESTHSKAFDIIKQGSAVLDIGSADGYLSQALRSKKGCSVTALDVHECPAGLSVDEYVKWDLNESLPPHLCYDKYDYVLLLDVIEHLHSPEKFLEDLRFALRQNRRVKVVLSTANVAFIITRLMLFMGYFNYGERGILDMTHTRLFTAASFLHLLSQYGYSVDRVVGVPAPIPMILGCGLLARIVIAANSLFAKILRNMFSYQIMVVTSPLPGLNMLLEDAVGFSGQKCNEIKAGKGASDV